ITDLKKAQDQLVIYRQAVLKKAFEGELTKEWRKKQSDLLSAAELLKQIKEERQNHYETQVANWKKAVEEWEKRDKTGKKPKKPAILKFELDLSKLVQELTDLPNNWTYINLDYAVYKLGDGLHGTPKYSETGDYYFINGNNLDNGKINIKPNTKKVDYSEFFKYQKDLNEDTVFVSINGTIGNVSFYNNEKVILGKSACYFNLLKGFDKNYIKWRIDSLGFRNYAFKNATGSTIKNVPLSAMRNYTFPLCSKQEQHQIVQEIESRLSVCDKVEENINDSLKKAQALRRSILKKAFEGKLLSEDEIAKCKADKDYEPASVLLERIKREKK
ncbi:restriction endonuclease subunit S, partial [Psychroserpens sp.]